MITTDLREFQTSLPHRGRLAGFDIGTRRIGLAFCDAYWTIATPSDMYERKKFTDDAARLRAQFQTDRVQGLVIGLPLNMDGSDSPQTQSVRAYARNLEAALSLPILLWDERWSTAAVTRAMIAADLSRAKRAERVDKSAAAYILQGAIDALANLA